MNSALCQTEPADHYELIVVDNNSTDKTAELLKRLTSIHPGRVRAVTERKQGVSHARNAGITAATCSDRGVLRRRRACDAGVGGDDSTNVSGARRTSTALAARSCRTGRRRRLVGSPARTGRRSPCRIWAIRPVLVSAENPLGLISANLACRRSLLDGVGGFSPLFQRVKDGDRVAGRRRVDAPPLAVGWTRTVCPRSRRVYVGAQHSADAPVPSPLAQRARPILCAAASR